MLKRLRKWLRDSRRVHIREPVSDVRACVAVIDAFLDNSPRYPLEWDDFVSWQQANPRVEAARKVIAPTEALFMSADRSQRPRGIAIVVAERNRLARLVGLPERPVAGGDSDAV